MEALFDIPEVRKQLRTSNGRYATPDQVDVDRKYRTVSKVENENYRLKLKIVELERTLKALRDLFAQHERFHGCQSMLVGFADTNHQYKTTNLPSNSKFLALYSKSGAVISNNKK